MKRWLAEDVAEYLAEFKEHVTPDLLAIQLYNDAAQLEERGANEEDTK